MLLERLGGSCHHDGFAQERRGNEVGQGLSCSRPRLNDEMVMLDECFFDRFGHSTLSGTIFATTGERGGHLCQGVAHWLLGGWRSHRRRTYTAQMAPRRLWRAGGR